jgi:cell division protein FtsB
MREFQVKKKVRRVVFSKWIVALMVLVFLFLAKATWNLYQKNIESAANVVNANRELARLEDRQQTLQTEIERLSTDEGVEQEIRTKYSVSKPGEQLIVIVDEEASSTPEIAQPESWWDKFKNLFR